MGCPENPEAVDPSHNFGADARTNVGKKEDEVTNIEVMDAGKCKDDEVDEQGQWLLDGKNNVGDHYKKSCSIVGYRRYSHFTTRRKRKEGSRGWI